MFEMDVMSKGLSWIDGMYQKFETVCMEVDENPSSLLKGTKKYVENQFSVIGENVKKFCAEVIQDILPPDTDSALKNIASNMTVNLGEDFDLSEKLNPEKLQRLDSESMPHETLKESFEYAGEDSNCVIPFPHELQKDIPVIYLKEPSESEIMELIPSLSHGDILLSEGSILKDVTQREFHPQREANLCNNTHVAYLAQEPTCVSTVAEHAPWKEKGSTNKSGAEFGIHNQKSRDMFGIDEMKINDNSIPRHGIVDIIGKTEKQFTEETDDRKENPEGHEKDGENNGKENPEVHEKDGGNTLTTFETFIPNYVCLSQEDPLYERLDGQEDEIEVSAYWYGYEDMDVEKWQEIEKCDSDWELL